MSFNKLDYARSMKYIGLLIALGFSVNITAQIYRSIDKDGNAVFSDVPIEGAEEIELTEPTPVESLSVNPLPARENSSRNNPEKAFQYASIIITTPMDDEAIRDNSGSVTITVSIAPQLRDGHKIVLYLDGKEHMSGQSPTFSLSELNRGTHTARISIKDESGKSVSSSKTTTFHLLRHSVLHKNINNAAPQSS